MKLMDYQNMRGGRVVLQDVCKPQVFIVTSVLKLALAELTLIVHLWAYESKPVIQLLICGLFIFEF